LTYHDEVRLLLEGPGKPFTEHGVIIHQQKIDRFCLFTHQRIL
jgi:hypothetical protein